VKFSGKELNQEETHVSFFRPVLIRPSQEAVEIQASSGYG